MRIISGKLKGKSIAFIKSAITRPLKDSVKESIFNIITHSNLLDINLEKSNILDLYSGIGSFGLECISRHAKSVCFVEKAKDALEILEKNIEKLKLKKNINIFFNDVFALIEKKNIHKLKFDLIFCDPPFKNINIEKLIELIFNKNLLKKDGIIILHRNKNHQEKLPSYFKVIEERIYGKSKVSFGKILF